MSTDILIPTFRRANRLPRVIENARACSPGCGVIIIGEASDPDTRAAALATGAKYCDNQGPASYAGAINTGAAHSEADWIFTGADDLEFTPGWFARCAQSMQDIAVDVIGTNDGDWPATATGASASHMLVRRQYIDQRGGAADAVRGQVLHDGYGHYCVEQELVFTAQARGRYAHCADAMVLHKPERTDAKAAQNEARRAKDRALYDSRKPLWKQGGLIADMRRWISRGKPFAFTRWGDGEWSAILQLRPGKRNTDGHLYFEDMGKALRRVISAPPPYLVGMQPLAKRIMGDQIAPMLRGRFEDADLFHKAAQTGDMFFRDWPDVMVGPAHLRAVFPGRKFIEIPATDCWLASSRVLAELRSLLPMRDQSIIGYCASMAANVWIDEMTKAFPRCTHVDFGSVFDPLAGVKSRSYMRKEGAR